MKTALKLYNLWYDGTVECKSKVVEDFISMVPSGQLAVDQITPDVEQYNSLVSKKDAVRTKTECKPLNFDWNIPEHYRTLDVKDYLMTKLSEMDDLDDDEVAIRISRTLLELKVYAKAGLMEMLRCLIYIIETLTEQDVVWGVGRGSSVSSYVLYLIGVHDIDCVLYELPFTDFMKG